jgi:hypothetical protein
MPVSRFGRVAADYTNPFVVPGVTSRAGQHNAIVTPRSKRAHDT